MFRHTMNPVFTDVFINIMKVASRLEVSSVGIEVIMCHSLLDAHTETQTFMGEGVDGVYKFCIIRGKPVCGRHALK